MTVVPGLIYHVFPFYFKPSRVCRHKETINFPLNVSRCFAPNVTVLVNVGNIDRHSDGQNGSFLLITIDSVYFEGHVHNDIKNFRTSFFEPFCLSAASCLCCSCDAFTQPRSTSLTAWAKIQESKKCAVGHLLCVRSEIVEISSPNWTQLTIKVRNDQILTI